MKVPQTTSSRPLAKAGLQEAYLYSIIDLGTIPGYQGKMQRKVFMNFELVNDRHDFNENQLDAPLSINRQYTFSMYKEAPLAKDFVLSWTAKPLNQEELENFDLSSLLGKPALVNVLHKVSASNGKTYANIGTVLPPMRPFEKPMYNPGVIFSIDEHGFESKEFNNLLTWIQDIIKTSDEYKAWTSAPKQKQPVHPEEAFHDQSDNALDDSFAPLTDNDPFAPRSNASFE